MCSRPGGKPYEAAVRPYQRSFSPAPARGHPRGEAPRRLGSNPNSSTTIFNAIRGHEFASAPASLTALLNSSRYIYAFSVHILNLALQLARAVPLRLATPVGHLGIPRKGFPRLPSGCDGKQRFANYIEAPDKN